MFQSCNYRPLGIPSLTVLTKLQTHAGSNYEWSRVKAKNYKIIEKDGPTKIHLSTFNAPDIFTYVHTLNFERQRKKATNYRLINHIDTKAKQNVVISRNDL